MMNGRRCRLQANKVDLARIKLARLYHGKQRKTLVYSVSKAIIIFPQKEKEMDLEMQLRAAEARRSDLQRAHAEALAALRDCGSEQLDTKQSRVRELEKKVALETVRCEELQLELATCQRNRMSGMSQTHNFSSHSNISGQQFGGPKGTEIDRIMAKIEQDNRILAELDHSRSTTMGGLATSASSHALGESSPPISPITMSHTTPSMYQTGTTLSHNYQTTQPSSLGSYLPSNSNYNPTNQYNSLGHSYTNKTMLGTGINSGLTNLSSLNQTSVLGTSLGTGMTSGVMGTGSLGTSLGTTGLSGGLPTQNYSSNVLPNSTYSNQLVSNSTTLPQTSFNNPSFNNPVTSTLNQYNLPYNSLTTTSFANNVTFSNPLSSQFNSLPLSSGMSIKLKPLEEVDLVSGRRCATPCTPHQTGWGLNTALGLTDTTRNRMLTDGLDSDWSGISGLHVDRSYLNGHPGEGTVDMLDIPGKGRCSVYIARFSYDPEDSEEELAVQAGDYLLVWGEPMGAGGYLDAELLDGRRGLVPSHFAQRLIGDDLLEFHQAVLSTLREDEINAETFAADVQRLTELAEMAEGQEDELDNGEPVPAPKQLTLERQLNKSVLISWTSPEAGPGNHIESYHVYVDGVLKTTIKATERTRALVEGVDSNRPHRISVRSVTANRRTSRDAACTMIIGRDTHQLGPSAVRASNITSTSAVISWLPANSNHQHVVCVNNVEVRCVKPGVYRHTITGLAPNTQYRVTVRAKHHRAAQNIANVAEDLPLPAAAHTDFRTLPKGLPDPPSDIQLEPGPQDGTLLVTWHPVLTPHHPGSTITGYAVFADGKKVTDVDSPTGDHALIDISKLLGLNPKHVTVRTKARDGQSADSVPTLIPLQVLRGGANKHRQPHSAMPVHMRQQMGNRQGQQVIEHDENLSDKEIFPNSGHRQQGCIPSIAHRSLTEITKENLEANLSEDEMSDRRCQRQFGSGRSPHVSSRMAQQGRQEQQQQHNTQSQQPQQYYQQQQSQQQQQQQQSNQQQVIAGQHQNTRAMRTNQQNPRGQMMGNPGQNPPTAQKRARWFVALFDYDPVSMSPNPECCDEELPFSEGDNIKVWGDKDADGFYWGECRGKRGYVPHNMVMEVEVGQNRDRDRWGDTYASLPMKRMVALYDYDPQELSPNVDAEVELSFTTGQIINVYGDMDDDGFYMGEIDGLRGLVPSNFLTEATDQYGPGQVSQQGMNRPGQNAFPGQRGRGHGPGARGPPPPPRDGRQRKTDACPVLPSQSDTTNTASPNTQGFTEHQRRGVMNAQRGGNYGQQNQQGGMTGMFGQQQQTQQHQQQQAQQQPQQQSTGFFGSQVSSLFGSSNTNQNTTGTYGQQTTGQSGGGGLFGQSQQGQQNQQSSMGQNQQSGFGQNQQSGFGQNQQSGFAQNQPSGFGQNQQNPQGGYGSAANRMQHKGIPQVIPTVGQPMNQMQQQQHPQQQQQPNAAGPNLMQKFNEITAPGGDILSKGKELIFMKFGLGGK